VVERISKEELTFYLFFKPERREENKVSLLVQKQALLSSSLSFSSLHKKEKENINENNNNYNMPLAKDVAMELEPPKTPETPTPTPILLSSSPEPLSEERSNTIHVQVGPRPFAIPQNLLLQKRGGGNSMITPERLRLSRPAPSMSCLAKRQRRVEKRSQRMREMISTR
jgi:hypothetical protein